MNSEWNLIQDDIAHCEHCREQFPNLTVRCPPGRIHGDVSSTISVLFVGVAPPRPGEHFNSSTPDKLRVGLFRVLSEIGFPCISLSDFRSYGFLLVHTAKCAYDESWKANLDISKFCAPKHLRREIEVLHPRAICILSKTVGPSVATVLAQGWGNDLAPSVGEITHLRIGSHTLYALVTLQPVRGWERRTQIHIAALFESAGLISPPGGVAGR